MESVINLFKDLMHELLVFDIIRIMWVMLFLLILYVIALDVLLLIFFTILILGVITYHVICKCNYGVNW